MMAEILQLVHGIASFPEVLCKRGDLNNFSKFTDKHKNQSPGGTLSKDVLAGNLNCQTKSLKMFCTKRYS